jgi:Phosphotransferase enzyme family
MPDTPGEIALTGGNVGGAVRVGDTVRRPAGPWTAAVHGLLDHLAAQGLSGVPRVHGYDESGREILDFLPGQACEDPAPAHILTAALRWLREYHRAVASYRPRGPVRWRTSTAELGPDQIICMHDFAHYNWIADGNEFAGVIDWDMAGPGVPMDDLAFAAWQSAPLGRDAPPERAVHRLRLMAEAYGDVDPREILAAAPARARRSVRVIRAGHEAGDAGMTSLVRAGVPDRTERAAADLEARIPDLAELI